MLYANIFNFQKTPLRRCGVNRLLCDLNNLHKPSCKYGYTRNDLVEMGIYTVEFLEWMRGKTYAICEGREFSYEKDEYVNTICAENPHGEVYYSYDVEKYIRHITSKEMKDIVSKAIKIILQPGQEKAEHKAYALDQALRILMGEENYKKFREELINKNQPYDEGIPPN